MKKIFEKLNAFSKIPQTKVEKFLTWLENYDEWCYQIMFGQVFLTPLLMTMIFKIKNDHLFNSLEGALLFYLIFLCPTLLFTSISMFILDAKLENHKKHPNKNYEKALFDYLNENKEGETKEFLEKMKILNLQVNKYLSIKKNIDKYLSIIEQDKMTENDIDELTQKIVNDYVSHASFLYEFEENLGKSTKELKAQLIQQIANKLKEENSLKVEDKLDKLIHDFANHEEVLFKKEKKLTTSL